MLRDVVAILGAEVHPFELGTICEVFGLDRSDDGLPGFDFAVCAARPGPRRTAASAGTAAGIDACLHIVRRELGAEVANGFARRMVVPPHRDGGQAQYVDTPVPRQHGDRDGLAPLLEWLQAHLDQTHTVAGLAGRVHMSPRTFARRFTATTGATPHQWITGQRVLLARRLLEHDVLDVATIARRTGFGTAEALRHHFARHLGTTPTAYRDTFSHRLHPAA